MKSEQRCIGLLGGLGVGAAVHYYRELARAHAARGAVLQLVMVHADMAHGMELVTAGKTRELAGYLCRLIERLKAAGADFAVIPAATPHICFDELAAISPLPLVNLLESTREAVQARGFRRVSLFGTRAVIESALFGSLSGVEVIQPHADEVSRIHDIYVRLARQGAPSDGDDAALVGMARQLSARDGAEAILLAGTDLALLFNESNTPFPHIDCAAVHLQSILRQTFQTG